MSQTKEHVSTPEALAKLKAIVEKAKLKKKQLSTPTTTTGDI